jgi:GT2 family glycosyltransferase
MLTDRATAGLIAPRAFSLDGSNSAPLFVARHEPSAQTVASVTFSVIVVSYNTIELTRTCLRSLQRHARSADVIVVDNASSDGSAEMISREFPEVRLIRLSVNIGFGRANSLAWKLVTEDFVALLNSDTVIVDDSLTRCVSRLLDEPDVAAVTPQLFGTDSIEQTTRHPVPTFRQTLNRSLSGRPLTISGDEYWIPGTCLILRRSAVEKIGRLFDPRLFIYWEDADLCQRLRNAGLRLAVESNTRVIHHGGASGGGKDCCACSGLHEWYTYGRHFWFWRHRPRWEAMGLWFLEFADAFRCMGRALIHPARRKEWTLGWSLLKTICRLAVGLSPSFGVPDVFGRTDDQLVELPSVSGSLSRNSQIVSRKAIAAGFVGELPAASALPLTKAAVTKQTPGNPPIPSTDGCGIVVIGRNEGDRLRRCFSSLPLTSVPVVYVDSGSVDGSPTVAVAAGVHVVSLDPSMPLSAARARNAGVEELLRHNPELQYVQFVDGDCELSATWLFTALNHIRKHSHCAIVCGSLRERDPESSVYNRLCQLEWKRTPGLQSSCGGLFLARVDAFRAVGGFRSELTAGEEPELCVRLRNTGWTILGLDSTMAQHDAAMRHFHQWWTRSIRSGHSYAQSYWLHRDSEGSFRAKEIRSILLFGLFAPLLAVVLAWATSGVSLLLWAVVCLTQACRIRLRRVQDGDTPKDATIYAAFVMLAKLPQALGVLRFFLTTWSGRSHQIIEYKLPVRST